MLELTDIRKSYKGTNAIDGVSLTLGNGLYGLLGPNGAGKSTLMGIITGGVRPNGGTVRWDGKPTDRAGREFRRWLGYAPQQQRLYDDMTGRRFLCYMAALKEIEPKRQIAECERVAGLVNLSDQLDKRLSAYSGGMKQRILTAQALIGQPRLLILDEPTAGLDPKERVHMRRMLSAYKDSAIILIATHVVTDVEPVADEIIMLKSGNVAAKGTVGELTTRYECKSMEEVYLHLFGEDDA